MRLPVVLNWSGGKDAALALYTLLNDPFYVAAYEVVLLLTAANAKTKRSSLHGIPSDLLAEQAKCLGIALEMMYIPDAGDLATYEQTMQDTTKRLLTRGIKHFAFGDIHLESVRTYREEKLNPLGITVLEPIWGFDSATIMQKFFDSGLQSMIMTANSKYLDEDFVGQVLSPDLIKRFPKDVDCCGENGEYHTFCFAGPIFKVPVPFEKQAVFLYEFHYKDEEGQPQVSQFWQLPLSVVAEVAS